MKWRNAVRITLGLVLVVAPDSAVRVLTRIPLDQRARLVARIVGVHHLTAALTVWGVEGGVSADQAHAARWSHRTGQVRTGSPDTLRRLSRDAEVLHALSMVTLALADPTRRRLALADAGIVALFSRAFPARTPPATPSSSATSSVEGGPSRGARQVPAAERLTGTPVRPRSPRPRRPREQPGESMSGAGGRPRALRVGAMAAESAAGDASAAPLVAGGDGSARDPARLLAPEIGAAGRRDREARRQQAIRDVLAVSAGLPVGEVTAELRRALALHGVGPQPEAWLDAVASDVALGNIYVVSEQAMADTGSVLPRAADEGSGTGEGGRDIGAT